MEVITELASSANTELVMIGCLKAHVAPFSRVMCEFETESLLPLYERAAATWIESAIRSAFWNFVVALTAMRLFEISATVVAL